MADEFTHLTESGVHMVEVGGKPDQTDVSLNMTIVARNEGD